MLTRERRKPPRTSSQAGAGVCLGHSWRRWYRMMADAASTCKGGCRLGWGPQERSVLCAIVNRRFLAARVFARGRMSSNRFERGGQQHVIRLGLHPIGWIQLRAAGSENGIADSLGAIFRFAPPHRRRDRWPTNRSMREPLPHAVSWNVGLGHGSMPRRCHSPCYGIEVSQGDVPFFGYFGQPFFVALRRFRLAFGSAFCPQFSLGFGLSFDSRLDFGVPVRRGFFRAAFFALQGPRISC